MRTRDGGAGAVWASIGAVLMGVLAVPARAQEEAATVIPDLSGMAWVEGDVLFAVHDAKRDAIEGDRPRVSLVRLPGPDRPAVTWEALDVRFPGVPGTSDDLESVARIPGEAAFLLAESGQEARFFPPRIFLARYVDGAVTVVSHVVWPVDVTNVEATAVARVGEQLVFLYAERADGEPATELRWAPLSLDPLEIGAFEEARIASPEPPGPGVRPVVALDVDDDGEVHIASAYDSGSDDGPFRSALWRIGRLEAGPQGTPELNLDEPTRLATLDGFKVESVVVTEAPDGGKQLLVGTDDENYGGVVRRILLQP